MNFNEHIVELLPAYLGGNDRKETVVLDDGEIWFLKIQSLKDKASTNQFCLYNAFSEYLGCKIFNLLGFET
ncbi:MAG: hypothetical protein LIO99_08705 [Clostridiales bacterium]|nr:hypothetical protein [Clostridiales bacterium]